MQPVCDTESAILDLIPVGVIAVDNNLRLLHLNRAACSILGIADAGALLGQPVNLLMEENGFLRLLEGEETYADSVFFGEDLRFSRSFTGDAGRGILVCVLHADAPRTEQDEELLPGQQRAAELADAISAKQLAIVHEIAGLLGESAVETRSMVRELKQALRTGKEDRHG